MEPRPRDRGVDQGLHHPAEQPLLQRLSDGMSLKLSQTVAVVLAGGFGTRVAHLLPGVPKPMVPVAGKPFLEWVVRFLARQGIPKAILSTGHLADVVEEYFRTQPVRGAVTHCIAETRSEERRVGEEGT